MAKIHFSIDYRPQIESGEYKVETEAGFPAKVMDWDYNNKICGKCIAVKVIEGDGDHGLLYTHKGKRASIFPVEEGSDLFIVTPEPELSEFEKRLAEIMDYTRRHKQNVSDEEIAYDAKRLSKELFELARDEINSHESLVEYAKKAKAEGKAEALKDLPRWKKAAASFGNYSVAPTETGALCLLVDGHYIMLSELMKLPGFNE